MSNSGWKHSPCTFEKTKFRPLATFTGGVNMQVDLPENIATGKKQLFAGTHLVGNPYNGMTKETWDVDASSTNVPNMLVVRNEQGWFAADTISVSSLKMGGKTAIEKGGELEETLYLGTEEQDLVVRGNLIADLETTIKGNAKLEGTLLVMDGAIIHHDLDAKQEVCLGSQEYETIVRGNLTVNQDLLIGKSSFLNGPLHVDESTTLEGRLEANDDVLLGSLKNITQIRGSANILGDVHVDSNLGVDGSVFFANSLHVNGIVTLGSLDQDTTVHGTLQVKQTIEANANVHVHDNMDVYGHFISHNKVHLGSNTDSTTIMGPCVIQGNLLTQSPITMQAPVKIQKKQIHEDDVYLQTNFLYTSAVDDPRVEKDYLVAHRTSTRNCPGVWKFAHESPSNTNGQTGTSLLDCGGIQTMNPDCENFMAGDLTIAGNLLVNGNTVSVETEVLEVIDPILTLGIDTNFLDNRDRGVEFRYYDNDKDSTQRGFFGWQQSNDRFVFFKSATRTEDTFTGILGNVHANDIRGEKMSAKQVWLQDDIVERTNHHIFYSSDGERVYPNTREGIQASMGLIPSTSNKPDRLVLRDAFGDFEARHAKLDGVFVGETRVIDADGSIDFTRLKNVPSLTVGQKASSEQVGAVSYTGHERTSGSFYGGDVSPDSDLRLNYDGHLYATRLFDDGIRVVNESRRIVVKEGLDYAGESVARDGHLDHDLNLRVDDTVVRTNGGTYTLTHGNLSFKGGGERRATGTTDASPFVIRTNDLDRIVISPSGHVGLGENPTPSEDHALKVDGSIFATQNVFGFSDARYKSDICIIEDALESVRHIDGVRFRWKDADDQNVNLGLLAQNVESVFPEVVTTDVDTGRKGVAYASLVPVLIQCIKELALKTERLETELRSLSR